MIIEESQIEPGCSSSRILSCGADNRGEEMMLRAPEPNQAVNTEMLFNDDLRDYNKLEQVFSPITKKEES